MKAFKIARKGSVSDVIMPGRLDEALDARLQSHVGLVRLIHRRKGEVISKGPFRRPFSAADPFAHTILTEGQIDDRFPVRGTLRRLFAVRCVEITQGDIAVEYARTEIGTKYRFGEANGPEDPGTDAFDCSGLCIWAWEQAGVPGLPHSAEQLRLTVPKVTTPRRGDIICMWFENSRGIPKGHSSHAGLYYSDSYFIHGIGTVPARMIDTRNPVNEPVAIRDIELDGVLSYHRPG